MSPFNNLFNRNIEKWNLALNEDDIPDEFKAIIENLLITDGIDFEKYLENEKANNLTEGFLGGLESWETSNSFSTDPAIRNLKINCTPTFKEHFANNRLNRAPFLPDWYYIAYPDVALWMHKNNKLLDSEIESRKNELFNEDGPKLAFYRWIINRYKNHISKSLECSSD